MKTKRLMVVSGAIISLMIISGAIISSATATAKGGEVNLYSYRQPFLIKPILDKFTAKTGITVNVK